MLKHMLNIDAIKKLTFLTCNAKKTFNYLRQMFTQVLIFQYFYLEYYF